MPILFACKIVNFGGLKNDEKQGRNTSTKNEQTITMTHFKVLVKFCGRQGVFSGMKSIGMLYHFSG